MPKLIQGYKDYSAGLNTDTSWDKLSDSELTSADNCDLSDRGAIKIRGGTTPFNSVSYNAQVERLEEWDKSNGTTILFGIIGQTLCKINEDGTKVDIQALASKNMGYIEFKDKIYFTDSAEYRHWDGTTVTIVPPKSGVSDCDLAPIKKCTSMVHHPESKRIFATGNTDNGPAVYYSESNEPDYFKQLSVLVPTTGDGRCLGLSVFGDAVVAHYRNSKWMWKGIDPATDAKWTKMPINIGTVNGQTVALTPNSSTFLSQGGLHSMAISLLEYNMVVLSSNELVVDLAENRVGKIIRSIIHPDTCCGDYDTVRGNYMLAYGDDPLNPRNKYVLVFNWPLKSFVRWTGLQVNDFCLRSNGDLLLASNNYILKAYQDAKKDWDVETGQYKAIEWIPHTKPLDLGFPDHFKKLKRTFISAQQHLTSSIDVTIKGDYVSLDFEGIRLDDSFYWGDEWGDFWGRDDYVMKELNTRLRANRIQIKLYNNTIGDDVTFYGVAFEFKPKKPKGVKVESG